MCLKNQNAGGRTYTTVVGGYLALGRSWSSESWQAGGDLTTIKANPAFSKLFFTRDGAMSDITTKENSVPANALYLGVGCVAGRGYGVTETNYT